MGVTDRDGFGLDRGREEAYVAYSMSEHVGANIIPIA